MSNYVYTSGSSEWDDLHIELVLKSGIDPKSWQWEQQSVDKEGVVETLTKTYLINTAYYKKIDDDTKCIDILCYKTGSSKLSILMYFTNDCEDGMVTLSNGLVVPYRELLNIENFSKQLYEKLSNTVEKVAVSRVPTEYLAKMWVKGVGGHRFMEKSAWSWEDELFYTYRDKSGTGTMHMQPMMELWDARRKNGCKLDDTCQCRECRREDHSDCKSTCRLRQGRGNKNNV